MHQLSIKQSQVVFFNLLRRKMFSAQNNIHKHLQFLLAILFKPVCGCRDVYLYKLHFVLISWKVKQKKRCYENCKYDVIAEEELQLDSDLKWQVVTSSQAVEPN